ncbi:nuclease (SNase domain-containing protein) [Desulfobulbus propionicus DSM 2032]|uniref:Nuclease (SNase domain-containing protein) n=1 Tax=Desulfobulbus propionicus (strain ATCC 33891 / DSM 2032 / VKM B-1956 / 1pr3) TaxID=577650 RepID=A0A7U3YJ91_DESPD|nr:thermonuclease family protein [Desulfobulbus propionicus]ADW16416.1 nuclease (SNase domain-containing protein) [Desulfobulbus propionicus DSM 2032]
MTPRIIAVALATYAAFALNPSSAFPHPGGLDSSGCHHNRKTGDYHCHRPGSTSSGGYSEQSPDNYYTPSERKKSGGYTAKSYTGNNEAQVVGITDGDTIKVLIEGQQVKIRLYGIDAPESGQAYGRKSQTALKQISAGRKISIKAIDHDRYGRVVALVYADGINVNEIMASSGYAWVYPQYCKKSFCREWKEKERMARTNRNGLWQDGDPTPPWEWRRKR